MGYGVYPDGKYLILEGPLGLHSYLVSSIFKCFVFGIRVRPPALIPFDIYWGKWGIIMDYTGCKTLSLYVTPESMARKVDEYFDTCFKPVLDKETGEYRMKEIKPPTYSGLARYLGFASRGQLLHYKNDDDRGYDVVIADARMRIEDYLEGKLVYSKAPTGIMFSLKNNAGWEDKTKQELSSDEKKPLVFGWVGESSDVIDVSEERKELPQGMGGALPVSTSEEEVVEV